MDELEVMRIRDEVLQAMYWMSAEGLAEAPTARELARFLAVPEETLGPYVERFLADGYLLPAGSAGLRLSAKGQETGKHTFAEEFAGMTGATHGECDEDCWCHNSPEAAADCLHERRGHAHSH